MGIGTPPPPAFDIQSYDAVGAAPGRWLKATGQGNSPPTVFYEFAGSWNALAYRTLACYEHSESFSKSIQKKPIKHRDIFEQESDLFEFFLNGLSALECFYYAFYCLAVMLQSGMFSVLTEADRKKINLSKSGISRLEKAFPNNEITPLLSNLLTLDEYDSWNLVRNVLVHRSTPPRHLYTGAPKTGTSNVWAESRLKEIGPLDSNTTQGRYLWLAGQIGTLLAAAAKFTAREFP